MIRLRRIACGAALLVYYARLSRPIVSDIAPKAPPNRHTVSGTPRPVAPSTPTARRLRRHRPDGTFRHIVPATRPDDGAIVEMTIWEVPEPVPGSAHRLKHSLFYGDPGRRPPQLSASAPAADHFQTAESPPGSYDDTLAVDNSH